MPCIPREIVDLTRHIGRGTRVFPGDPRPVVARLASLEREGFETRLLVMADHTGTHVDAPRHFFPSREGPAEIPVERLVGPGVLVDLSWKRPGSSVGEHELGEALEQQGVGRGWYVLLYYAWDERPAEEWLNYPVLTPGAAALLARLGVRGVGMDTPSPDREPYTVHKILLGSGVLVLENLSNEMRRLIGREFTLVVGALPVEDATGSPARVLALIWE